MNKILKFYVQEVEQDELDNLTNVIQTYRCADRVIDSIQICQVAKNKVVIGVVYKDY